jgi:hypothetical protein
VKRRYPLEPLGALRKQRVDDRTRQLSAQMERVDQARGAHAAARRTREREEAQLDRTARAERERLARGEARAGDLAREAIWARAEAGRVAGLRRSELAASEREQVERKREIDDRHALARADADARAVERHRERWQADRERGLERNEEDEALDRFNARRKGRK